MERPAKVPRLSEDLWGAEVEPGFSANKDLHSQQQQQQQQPSHPFQPPQPPQLDPHAWEPCDYDDYNAELEQFDPNYSYFLNILPDDFSNTFVGGLVNNATKRSHQTAFDDTQFSSSVAHDFPEFLPRIPSPKVTSIEQLDVENPFVADDGRIILHPAMTRLRNPLIATPVIVLNGFVKAIFHVPTAEKKPRLSQVPLRELTRFLQPDQLQGQVAEPSQDQILLSPPQLPPNFGDVSKLDQTDRKLFEFFTGGVCKGRTVIVNDNTYLKQIAPMADVNKGVKHAILALAASYVLDYTINEMVQSRANHHHCEAVRLLTQDIRNPEYRAPGKGDALIASLILLGHNECINWEIDRRKEQYPSWYRAAIIAEDILEASNPALQYEIPNNVQLTRARAQLANRVCLDSVLCHCVYPFDARSSRCNYPWLNVGTPEEKRRIIGFTGLSAELMFYFVKITYLSARRFKKPTRDITPRVGREAERILDNFWQWSELSEDRITSEALLQPGELDEAGKVTTNVKVTEMVANSYVFAAQIYLQCRFFRLQRSDPLVQNLLWKLLRSIDLQPTTGPLFTAQTPLFSVFIGGMVAYRKADRDVIRAWFDPICTGSRGNVPPTYEALKHMWVWLDEYWREHGEVVHHELEGIDGRGKGKEKEQEHNKDEHNTDTVKADNSDAWWEDMVAELSANYGRVNLA